MRQIALLLIRGYQRFISPLTPPSCIYTPSCSQYGYEAIKRYGVLRGGWLTIKRGGSADPAADVNSAVAFLRRLGA